MADKFSGLHALCQLLQTSIGPLGLDKIVANDMQQVLCTTSGSEILSVLHPTDPLLGMAVQSAQDFVVKHGDGSKRLLMMTAAGAWQAMQEAEGATGSGTWHGTLQPSFARLCHSLAALQGSSYITQLAQQVAEALTVPVTPNSSISPDTSLDTSESIAPHPCPAPTVPSSHVSPADPPTNKTTAPGNAPTRGSSSSSSSSSHSSDAAAQQHLQSISSQNPQQVAQQGVHACASGRTDLECNLSAPDTVRASERTDLECKLSTPDARSEAGAVRRVVRALLMTSFTNRLGRPAVRALVDLLMDLIMSHLSAHSTPSPAPSQQHSRDPNTAATTAAASKLSTHHHAWWTTLHALAVHTPLCQAPGESVSASRLLKGVLLHSGRASKHMELPSAGVRFAILNCSLDSPGTVTPASVRVTSPLQYQQLLQSAGDQLAAALQVLADSLRVGLLVCTHRCSDLVVFRCLEAGLVLTAGVEEEEAMALCRAAGIQAVTSIAPAVLKEADVGEATSVEELSLGAQQKGLLIGLAKCGGTALVCGPTEGLCRQYAKCMVAGLKLLESSCTSLTPTRKPGEGTADGAGRLTTAGPLPCAASGTEACNAASTSASPAGPLPALPGGCAFDAALAAVLSRHMDLLHMKVSPALHKRPGHPSPLSMQGADALLAEAIGMGTKGQAQAEMMGTLRQAQKEAMGIGGVGHTEGRQQQGGQGYSGLHQNDHCQQLQACCEQPQQQVQRQAIERQQQQQQQQQQHVQLELEQHQLQVKDQEIEQERQKQQQCVQLDHERRQLLLPGVRVLHAMASAVPQALARTAQGQEMVPPKGARSDSTAPAAGACSNRAPLMLVHELQQQAQRSRGPVGLVVPKAAMHKAPRPGWPGKTPCPRRPCTVQADHGREDMASTPGEVAGSECARKAAQDLPARPLQGADTIAHHHQQQQQQQQQQGQWYWQQQQLEDVQMHIQEQDKAVAPPPHVPDCAAAADLNAPTHTTLPSTSMRVGLPACHGLVETVQLVLALWEAATSLLIQLLRIDAVLPARRPENQGPLLQKAKGAVSRPAVRKGGKEAWRCGRGSDNDESGAGD